MPNGSGLLAAMQAGAMIENCAEAHRPRLGAAPGNPPEGVSAAAPGAALPRHPWSRRRGEAPFPQAPI
jgi:hypothetical protein